MTTDDSWRRLPVTLPCALLLAAALLLGFLRLVTEPRSPARDLALDARLVLVPGPGGGAPAAAASFAPPAPQAPPEVRPRERPPPVPVRRTAEKAAPVRHDAAPAAVEEGAQQAPPSDEAGAADATHTASLGPGGAAGGGFGGGRSAARAIYQPLPEIPDSLRHQHLDLVAVARFAVAADGSAQVELLQATAEPALNTSLLRTLRTWRFFPAVEEGRPVASTLDIRVPITVR